MKECLQRGAELVQSIADALFNLPSSEDIDGPLVKLPPPTTRLPREKHVIICFFLSVIPHLFFFCLDCFRTMLLIWCTVVLDYWNVLFFSIVKKDTLWLPLSFKVNCVGSRGCFFCFLICSTTIYSDSILIFSSSLELWFPDREIKISLEVLLDHPFLCNG